ncbi:MAG: hypothetical protein LW875_04645 [Proteobacteria bacterium]|nr:hypothetical protein [Pseudomonadota bacterium]
MKKALAIFGLLMMIQSAAQAAACKDAYQKELGRATILAQPSLQLSSLLKKVFEGREKFDNLEITQALRVDQLGPQARQIVGQEATGDPKSLIYQLHNQVDGRLLANYALLHIHGIFNEYGNSLENQRKFEPEFTISFLWFHHSTGGNGVPMGEFVSNETSKAGFIFDDRGTLFNRKKGFGSYRITVKALD